MTNSRAGGGLRLAVASMVLALACLAGAPAAQADPACTTTWSGGGSDASWSTPGNWAGATVPTAGDVVCLPAGATARVTGTANAATVLAPAASISIEGGTLSVADAATASSVGTLALTNGALDGAANVHVVTALTWSGGAMQGSGATVVDDGATATIDAPGETGNVSLDGRTLINDGTLTFVTGQLSAGNGAVIRNRATLQLRSESASWGGAFFFNGNAPEPQLINDVDATLVKDAGTGTSRIAIKVDNEGAIEAHGGRVDLNRGGGPNTTGTWSSSGAGAGIAFSGGALALPAGSRIAGRLAITGADVTVPSLTLSSTLTLSAGSLTLTDAAASSTAGGLTQSGGTLAGAGALAVAGAFSWTGGTMSGSGSTVLGTAASGAIAPEGEYGTVRLDGRTLVNHGLLLHTSGTIFGAHGAVVDNHGVLAANSQVTTWGAAIHDDHDGDAARLINRASGTLIKDAGSGQTTIDFAIQSAGAVDAQTGALRLPSSANPVTLSDGATLAGTVQLAGANATTGDVDGAAADVRLTGGSLTVADGKTTTLGTLAQTGGTVGGAGTLEVDGALTWSGGTMAGSGTTALRAGAEGTVNPAGDYGVVELDQRTLLNEATLTFASGTLRGTNGAVLRNAATLVANAQGGYWDAFVDGTSGAPPQLVNAAGARLVKDGGTGTTAIGWVLDDAGELDAVSGRLSLNGSGRPATFRDGSTVRGALAIAGASVTAHDLDAHAAQLALSSGTLAIADEATATVGTLEQTGGTIGGAGELDIAGALTWGDGQMIGSGSTVLLSGATGLINPAGEYGAVVLDQRTLSNRGTLDMPRGAIRAAHGAVLRNSGTMTLDSESSAWGAALVDANDGARPQLVNTGTLRKEHGTASSGIGFAIDNEGAVEAHSGRLAFSGGGAPNTDGSWAATGGAGTSIDVTGGALALGADADASGALRITNGGVTVVDLQLDGSLTVSGAGRLTLTGTDADSHATSLTQAGGTIDGPGVLAISDAFRWTDGLMAGTGSTVLGTEATGTIDAPGEYGAVRLERRTLANAGQLTLAHGTLRAGQGATLRNDGTLAVEPESSPWGAPLLDTNDGAAARLVNTADSILRKSAGDGLTALALQIDSLGTIDAATGRLGFPASLPVNVGDGSTLRGVLALSGAPVTMGEVDAADADVRLTGGTLATTAGRTASLGRLQQSAGAVDGPGVLKIVADMDLVGGTMRGAGRTVVAPSAVGLIHPPDEYGLVQLEERDLETEGLVEHRTGTLRMARGSDLLVENEFRENSEARPWGSSVVDANEGVHPRIIVGPNAELSKTAGGGLGRTGVQVQNFGTVTNKAPNATLEVAPPSGVAEPCQDGTWRVLNGGKEIAVTSGLHCLAETAQLEGPITIGGSAEVTTTHLNAASADITINGAASLSVDGAATTSTVRSLTVTGGTLKGAGRVDVVQGLTWLGGTMTGPGTTALGASSVSLVNPAGDYGLTRLDGRTLLNAGTLSVIGGTLRLANTATLQNAGTFRMNSEASTYGDTLGREDSTASRLLNTGTLEKTTGTGTTSIGVPFVNDGEVHSEGGRLRFTTGGAAAMSPGIELPADPACQPIEPSNGGWTTAIANNASIELASGCDVLGTGTTLGGTIRVSGASVTVTNPAAGPSPAGSALRVDHGSVWVTSGSTLTVGTLQVADGSVANAGAVHVATALDWTGGRFVGRGTTTLAPGALGRIHPDGSCVRLDQARMVNAGSLTWDGGCILVGPGGGIVNQGAIHLSAASGATRTMDPASGAPSDRGIFINTGDLIKEGPGTIVINVPAISTGSVQVNSGDIRFNDGDGEDITGDVEDGPEVTPDGRELTGHASDEREDEDIDLFAIDEVIDGNDPVHQENGNDRYYDEDLNITVVTEPGGDKIITVYIGR